MTYQVRRLILLAAMLTCLLAVASSPAFSALHCLCGACTKDTCHCERSTPKPCECKGSTGCGCPTYCPSQGPPKCGGTSKHCSGICDGPSCSCQVGFQCPDHYTCSRYSSGACGCKCGGGVLCTGGCSTAGTCPSGQPCHMAHCPGTSCPGTTCRYRHFCGGGYDTPCPDSCRSDCPGPAKLCITCICCGHVDCGASSYTHVVCGCPFVGGDGTCAGCNILNPCGQGCQL